MFQHHHPKHNVLHYDPRDRGQHPGECLCEIVKRRAFEIYTERLLAGEPGSPADDWFAAEAEVLARVHPVDRMPRD